MAEFDWKKFVGSVAPALGAALGGPLAGAAVSALATALLGDESATEADVARVLASGQLSGEQVAALKQAEFNFQVRMRELDIDVLKVNQAADEAYLKDVQDARARQVATKDHMPQIILAVAFAFYALQIALFYFGKMPTDEFTRALVVRAFGTIDGVLLTCVAYFVGSSKGSKTSGDAVRMIAQQHVGKP